jgi:hypothetical protein
MAGRKYHEERRDCAFFIPIVEEEVNEERLVTI